MPVHFALFVMLCGGAAGLRAASAPPRAHHTTTRYRTPRMMAQRLTVRLLGCSLGVGVRLAEDGRVDMLREGSPAAAAGGLRIGDRVLKWNGVDVLTADGKARKLGEVVETQETHKVRW